MDSFLTLLQYFCDVPKTFGSLKDNMKSFGIQSYDLLSCAACNRYVWPNCPTKTVPCPLCGSSMKIIVNYIPTTSYHSLMFAGNKHFCNEYAEFQRELAAFVKERSVQPTSTVDWYTGSVGMDMLKKFDYQSTIFCEMTFDGLNKSKSSTLDAWPVVMKTASLPPSIRNDPQYMFISSMITYTKKVPDIDNALIPVLEEMEYLGTHAIQMFNRVTNQIQSFRYCVVSVSCDLDAWFKAFCCTHWASKCGCYMGKCLAESEENGVDKNGRIRRS
jgi:hypothetical protein